MLSIFLTGVLTGLALIVAVGAQNAFVLRQGIRGEHVLAVIVVCMVSDIVALTAGVAGLGVVMERWPAVLPIAQIGGGLYLLAFGVQSALRAWRPVALDADGGSSMTVRRAVLLTLALTWLNPHFYLDAILMLGTVANSFGDQRWWFCAGAIAASLVWFPALGFGARSLRGIFARPSAWRVLDSGIAVLMGALGIGLLVH
ncbi:amino acid transporter [Nocardioides sp. Soil777]|jgi:L-lysine exporter family protein LysE/ArgO|uniref:LysE/ArgO family amino acid transporter n=1 Tax=Nocardioides sp. Soil777 TaxID=1736409 RepID=UPI000702ABC2|nr:LysE/ArgO family amino acid transporter [Nocardioides sp. Soil777]KRF07764.1 amino acid transporter [Nocardioides sp. Soil777]